MTGHQERRTWGFSPHDLVEQFGSPLYVYEEKRIRRQIDQFFSIPYRPLNVYFASMSNNNVELLRFLHQQGVCLFVNTPKHLLLGLSAGFEPSRIVFTSTNLSREDMMYAKEHQVVLNLDSLGQLERYGQINPGAKVGLRVNILSTTRYHEGAVGPYFGPKSRIGIAEEEFDAAFAIARKHRLTINGIHAYLGTNILDADLFLNGADEIFRVADRFSDLEYLDLGGGFGVTYRADEEPLDMERLGVELAARMERLSKAVGRPIELAIEPGRSMFSDTGYFLTSVTDVKERPDRYYVGVDSSVDIFPRPLYYDVYTEAYHEMYVSDKLDAPVADKLIDICGSTTYSRDYLARDRRLPLPEVGDVLIFLDAGAYSYSLITDFLGRLRPPEVMVHTDGTVRLIREGEKLPVLMQG